MDGPQRAGDMYQNPAARLWLIEDAERPVVQKETVPVERVRLGTETVTEERQISEQVRKEQIDEPEVDGDQLGRNRKA